MKKLYLAEICKIKRMKMTYVAYIGILFSMIISSVQLLGRVQDATFEQLASMFTYNNVLLVLPFCLSLIGGYIIDREYTQNTQKNLFTIPVRWSRVIKRLQLDRQSGSAYNWYLFCICGLCIWIFGNYYTGYSNEHRQQYFHERISQKQTVRCHASGRNE